MSDRYDAPEEGLFLRLGRHCLARTKDRGCNPGLIVTDEGIVFVDLPQRPTDALAWIAGARQIGRPLVLVNTEHHMDHCAGNALLDVPIIAQRGTRERFFDVSPVWGTSVHDALAMFRRIDPEGAERVAAAFRIAPPQILFDERLILQYGGIEIRLIHLPGHLPNSTVVHVPADDVVYMSDNLFSEVLPWLHEADPRAWIQALETVKSWSPRVLVPGHGPVCRPSALDRMREFLEEFLAAIAHAIEQGWSMEETAGRVDFLGRFAIPPHLAPLAPKVQRVGVERTYRLLAPF